MKTNLSLIFVLIVFKANCQEYDTKKAERFSVHAQTTVITQFKPAFKADYSGKNSLITGKENTMSVTSTLFMGARLWKGASLFLNPEIGGGAGFSGSLGVAASANGETYRIGDPTPQFELARAYFRQIIPLTGETQSEEGDFNKLAEDIPETYLSLVLGKICISDFFDNNRYNHDPRTQFMSWGLMNNGAWDFPANTRGYTPSAVIEFVTPVAELRYGFSLVPKEANGMAMNRNIKKAGSHTLEYTHHYSITGMNGTLRILSFFTTTDMGNYNQSVALNPAAPDITATRKYGRTKYGFGINVEQSVSENAGIFFRGSWNDGKNETWAYTEIDHTFSFGISTVGRRWNRENDVLGLGFVVSGLSNPHMNYLKAGGFGFMLGDGNLNYAPERLAELYYSFGLSKNIYVSGAYQYILNPGYNGDRGPCESIFCKSAHFHLINLRLPHVSPQSTAYMLKIS